MDTINNTGIIPDKSVIAQHTENMQEWVNFMDSLAEFAKTTPREGAGRICVLYSQSLTPSDTFKHAVPGLLNNWPEGEPHTIFDIECGDADGGSNPDNASCGDLNFCFNENDACIGTWYRGGEHEKSDAFEALIRQLLEHDELSNIMATQWGKKEKLSFTHFDGSCNWSIVNHNDALLILKRWIDIVTPMMKKEPPKFILR